jgi:hypothetical protein
VPFIKEIHTMNPQIEQARAEELAELDTLKMQYQGAMSAMMEFLNEYQNARANVANELDAYRAFAKFIRAIKTL